MVEFLRRVFLVALLVIAAPVPGRAQEAQLNLRDADLNAFIELVAQITGRNFIVDPRVRGTVTIIVPEELDPETVYQVFLNVLALNSFAVVEGEGADRIVPVQSARAIASTGADNGFVTRVLTVRELPLDEAVEIIRPLLPGDAVITVARSARQVIISDQASNIDRVVRLLRRVDQPADEDVEVVTLDNAAAGTLVEALAGVLPEGSAARVRADAGANALVISGPAEDRQKLVALARQLDRAPLAQAEVVPLSAGNAAEILPALAALETAFPNLKVAADPNSNAIILSGPEAGRRQARALLRELDRPRADQAEIVTLDNTAAVDAVAALAALETAYPTLKAAADPSANTIVLSGPPAARAQARTLLRDLDGRNRAEVEVVTLANADAQDVADTMATLKLAFPDLTITANDRANALLISGGAASRAGARALAQRLDRPRDIADATVIGLKYADATEIEAVVGKLFSNQPADPGGSATPAIVADVTTNSVLISAPPDLLKSITSAVRALDQQPSQVLIEGVIFEMGAEKFAELGVQFGAIFSDVFVGGTQFAVGEAPTLGSLVTALLGGNVPALSSGLNLGGLSGEEDGVAGLLSALARDTTTNILATPSILTLDNQAAEIVVAQNVPFVTGRFAQVGESAIPDQPFQTIQRQDVGLTLKVTPQITADDKVRLRVEQEVSNLTNAAAASGSEITQRRTINTSILVRDGRLVLLGGLLQDQTDDNREKVPGLGDAPLLGNLFSAKSATGSKRILLLLLRPTVIDDDEDYARATERSYETARARGAELAAATDDRYPYAERRLLPPLSPPLGEPFEAGGAGVDLRFPPLPPRIDFGGIR